MKKKFLALLIMFMVPGFAFAAKKDDASNYNLNFHVIRSEIVYGCNHSFMGNPSSCGMRLWVLANINGEILELRTNFDQLIRRGDYKAKELGSESAPDYIDNRRYQVLFPDGQKQTFDVVGLREKSEDEQGK